MHAIKDTYESRVAETPRVLERMEPVLYGGVEAPGPLTRDQMVQYDREGFLRLPGFFPERTVNRLSDELTRLQGLNALRRSPAVITEPRSGQVRSIFAVHRLSPVFKELTTAPGLVGMAEQILGQGVYIHQSRVNLKPGFDGKEFNWHSDFETWHVEDGMPGMRAFSCFVALTENQEQNGPLLVIPGSHRSYVSCVGKTPENNFKTSLQKQVYGVPDPGAITRLTEAGGLVSLTGPPGTLVIFDCNLLHGSNSNITPFPRTNAFFVYNSVRNALVEPFGGGTPRPEFLACRKPVALQTGGAVARTI